MRLDSTTLPEHVGDRRAVLGHRHVDRGQWFPGPCPADEIADGRPACGEHRPRHRGAVRLERARRRPERLVGVQDDGGVGRDQEDAGAEDGGGPPRPYMELGQVRRIVQGARGGERGERQEGAGDFGVDGAGQRLGGAFQPALEGVAVGVHRRRHGDGADREGGQERCRHEGDEVRPQAVALRCGRGW